MAGAVYVFRKPDATNGIGDHVQEMKTHLRLKWALGEYVMPITILVWPDISQDVQINLDMSHSNSAFDIGPGDNCITVGVTDLHTLESAEDPREVDLGTDWNIGLFVVVQDAGFSFEIQKP